MAAPRTEDYRLAVSVISKTPLGVRTIPEIEEALRAGADIVHVDIMDGKYVGRKALEPGVISVLRDELDGAYIEAHLIAREPDLQPCIDAGADCVILQASGYKDPADLYTDMWKLRQNGLDVGIAFRPDEAELYLDPRYEPHLRFADITVFMASHYGQKTGRFFPGVIRSVREYRGIDEECCIQVDGVSSSTIRDARWAGADSFVARPSAVFKHNVKIKTKIQRLRRGITDKREPARV